MENRDRETGSRGGWDSPDLARMVRHRATRYRMISTRADAQAKHAKSVPYFQQKIKYKQRLLDPIRRGQLPDRPFETTASTGQKVMLTATDGCSPRS